MSMKDFSGDKASKVASYREAQVNTRGGADVAVTCISVHKKIALSIISCKKPKYFEEQLVRNVKCAVWWQVNSFKTFRLNWLNLQLCLPT